MKSTIKHRASGWLYLFLFFLTLGLSVLLTFALTLPFNHVQNNAVQSATVLPSILLTLIEFCEICIYAVGASLILFSAYRPFSVATTLRLGGIYILSALLRYALDLVNVWMLYGTRMFFQMMLEPNLLRYIPYFLLDIVFVLLVMILAQLGASRYYRKHAVLNKASVLLSKGDQELERSLPFYPFTKVLSLKNPLQFSTLILAAVLSLFNILSEILFVRYTSVWRAIGGYAADLLMGVVFYVLCMFLFRLLFAKQEKLSK